MAGEWTEADLLVVTAAIARGVLTVTLAGESITYHSLDELRALRAEMLRAINTTTTQNYRVAATSKGL